MPFIQPHTYVASQNLDSDNIKLNEEALQDYVNQEVVTADIGQDLKYSVLAKGELCAVDNYYEFVTSDTGSQNQLELLDSRSYQTSTAKPAAIQTTGVQWQGIANIAARVKAKAACEAIVTYYILYAVEQNTNFASGAAGHKNGGPGDGHWQNEVILITRKLNDGSRSLYELQTDGYGFAPTGAALDTLDPGGGANDAAYRSIMVTQKVTLTEAGTYGFGVAVNPHAETAYASARSITVELFYL
jgi:hypothetical protein